MSFKYLSPLSVVAGPFFKISNCGMFKVNSYKVWKQCRWKKWEKKKSVEKLFSSVLVPGSVGLFST